VAGRYIEETLKSSTLIEFTNLSFEILA